MLTKKIPETNEDRLIILQAIIEQEKVCLNEDKVLSEVEFQELINLTGIFDAANTNYNQVVTDRNKAITLYNELLKNAKLYVSHFIQVLLLTVIRNEIKPENLLLYGFPVNNPVIPDLSTEKNVLHWGEKLMQGESERIYKGGIPLYNPAIAKVKVHYELFKESIHSLTIYEKNLLRLQNNMDTTCKNADELIKSIWKKVEEKFRYYATDAQISKLRAYKIQFLYRKGVQLNVFE